MAANKCQAAGAVGVIASLMIAAGLGATLYVTNRNTETTLTTSATTTANTTSAPTVEHDTRCGYCGSDINVTLRVENGLVETYFNQSVRLVDRGKRELIFFLQAAADIQDEFKFSANYGQYGFLITTMNGLEANYTADKTWWRISDGNNVPLNLGVSSYIPDNEETIVFTYVQSSGH